MKSTDITDFFFSVNNVLLYEEINLCVCVLTQLGFIS